VRRITIPDTDPPLVALVYADEQQGPPTELRQWFTPVSLIVALLLVLAGIAWFLRRWLIEPLTATSEAADRIARGELDISLPPSRVREVDRLGRSFEAMSADLQRSLGQQAHLEQERRELISAIAHDLRTPLFSLRGSLEGLATGVAKTPEQQRRYLDIARAKADHLERLIADLFTFTRLEFMEERPRLAEVDLRILGREVMTSAAPRAGARRLVVVGDPGDEPVTARADLHMLTRALDNLLDNALRHTPNGGMIRLETSERETGVMLELTDSGPGFAASDLPHLFEPLFRGDAARNTETGGAGLGLTVARRIVEAHGGRLEATNAPEGGARVTMTLPRAEPAAANGQAKRAYGGKGSGPSSGAI
jgi:signal transduction histidine kinase